MDQGSTTVFPSHLNSKLLGIIQDFCNRRNLKFDYFYQNNIWIYIFWEKCHLEYPKKGLKNHFLAQINVYLIQEKEGVFLYFTFGDSSKTFSKVEFSELENLVKLGKNYLKDRIETCLHLTIDAAEKELKI